MAGKPGKFLKAKPKMLFLVTEDWAFCSHRMPIALAAKDAGFEVVLATRVQAHGEEITTEGIRLIPIQLRRKSKNPWSELKAILEIVKLYKQEQPDIVHHVALKPVIYGSIAARIVNTPAIVNALTGMGHVFISDTWEIRILRLLVKIAFRILLNKKGARVILQNKDDLNILTGSGMLAPGSIRIIRGSGVDMQLYTPKPEPDGTVIVMMASRMLWDKGVGEFIEAAHLLKQRGVRARFVLVGNNDPDNPTSLSPSQLEALRLEGLVEWWGYRKDMPKALSEAHIVCLPSYREGLPKVLIEASAVGRPIITTDVAGCREVVKNGENGFLVPARNPSALADAIYKLIESPDIRRKMGCKGRAIAVAEFSVEKVTKETVAIYEELLSGCKAFR